MQLSEAILLARFDRMVQDGIALYNPDQIVTEHVDGSLKFRFVITPAFAKKPNVPDTKAQGDGSGAQQQGPSTLRPGSDIDINGFELGDISDTHFLAMNKFCFIRPHVLLLTKDGHRRQHEPLDRHDLEAARATLAAVGASGHDYTIFFNCGVNGGCSRLHKHLQLIPYPRQHFFAAFLDGEEGDDAAAAEPKPAPDVPYVWFHHRFGASFDRLTADDLLQIYTGLLEQSTAAAGYQPGADERATPGAACPHNVVLTQRWILVIPRRRAVWGEAATNTLGMLGIVPGSKQSEVDAWLSKGPANVLREFGVPRSA